MAKKEIPFANGEPCGEASSETDEALSFEESLQRLEEVVGLLEGGQLGLSESLAQYEQGVKYLKFCYLQLERAERKIELLSGVDAEGRVQTQPFAEADMSLEEKQAARSRRRSRRPAADEPDAEIDDSGALF
ncbi:MAG: exodeoxyribonuclease VII small subunit [Pirellulaceae bacterium]